jgi:hypothetical protein
MRVAIYARVSTDAQEAKGTIGSQLEALRERVGANGGELVGEYIDDGVSGARLDRPGLDALRDAAEAGLIDAVLCLTPDRLSRSYAYQVLIADELARHGVAISYLDAPDIASDPQARLLTQIGARLSPASWSALERSVDGGRIREITADQLVAFARAFDVPIGFFLTPPSAWDNHVVATPDAGEDGLEPIKLFDVVIGTPENLAAWEEYLLSWPSPLHRARIGPDGRMEELGRLEPDVHPRLADPAALRARLLLREQFGDLDQARDVLSRLSTILAALDEPDDTDQPEPARRTGRRQEAEE